MFIELCPQSAPPRFYQAVLHVLQSHLGAQHNLSQQTQVGDWNLLSQETARKRMLDYVRTDTRPHGITGYLQKSPPRAIHKAALLTGPSHTHGAGAGVRLKAAPISML